MPQLEVTPVGLGGLLKRAEITVDGRRAAMVRLSSTARVDLPAGRHVVRARLRAAVSNELVLEVDGDDKVVSVILDVGHDFDYSLGGVPGAHHVLTLRLS